MSTATTEPATPPRAARVDPGLGATIRSEWDKARTARAPRRNLILGTVLGIALSLLLAVVTGATFDEWGPNERAEFDPVLFPLSGSLPMTIFFIAAVVGLVAPEYGSGMIRLTLASTPRRWRVLAAKTVVAITATSIATLVTVVVMMVGCQAIFSANDLPTASVGDADLWRAIILLVATGPVFPVIGIAAAFVMRSAAGAVSATLALIFVPAMVGGLLPEWWERNVLSLLPGAASDSLAIAHVSESPQHLHPALAVVVLLVWTVGMLFVAYRALESRDP